MGTPDMNNLPHYTWDDYQHWEGYWELIDGIAYAMSPAPSILHQTISQKIAAQFELALSSCPSCQALLPVDWKIDEDTVVQPDNLIICGEIAGNYLTKAPQLIVEILSKSSEQKDKVAKFGLYEKEGVKYYLIVDPESQVVKVYDLFDGRYVKKLDASHELLDFKIAECDFKVDLSKIWP